MSRVDYDKIQLHELPVPSNVIDGGAEVLHADGRVVVRYRWFEDGARRGEAIEFERVRASRYRAESHCTAELVGAYDSLVEVRDSAWAAQVRAETADGWKDFFALNHYLLYLDGAYEFLAESWKVVPDSAQASGELAP